MPKPTSALRSAMRMRPLSVVVPPVTVTGASRYWRIAYSPLIFTLPEKTSGRPLSANVSMCEPAYSVVPEIGGAVSTVLPVYLT